MKKNQTGKLSKFKIQLLIFLVFFLLAEIILRCFGYKAGTLIDDFIIEKNPVYLPRFVSDEMGINHLIKNSDAFMRGTFVNAQGFRGRIDYSPEILDSIRKTTGRKIIMLVGDSYVEGCCADSLANSFPDLVARNPEYEILNFGIAGTDPLQYELIVKKYAALLKPDMVVVVVYFGNDFFTCERKPVPGSPLTFPFKKNKWIYAVTTDYLSMKVNYSLKTPEEAYEFYMTHYTLRGKNRNIFQKCLSYSVIISKLYLVAEHAIKRKKWEKISKGGVVDTDEISHKKFSHILNSCKIDSIPCMFVGIPSPSEADEGTNLKAKYKNYFKEIVYDVPYNLAISDYDGRSAGNHFNNLGHKKYADFLYKLLNKRFGEINNKKKSNEKFY